MVIARLSKIYRTMRKHNPKENIVCSVAGRIVKFYCGLFSHTLSALKFQPNFPLNKKECDEMSYSESADTSRVNR